VQTLSSSRPVSRRKRSDAEKRRLRPPATTQLSWWKHGDESVVSPRSCRDAVAVTTPEINNLYAVAVDGDGGSDLLAADHIAAETSASLPYPSSTSPAIVPGRHLDPHLHGSPSVDGVDPSVTAINTALKNRSPNRSLRAKYLRMPCELEESGSIRARDAHA